MAAWVYPLMADQKREIVAVIRHGHREEIKPRDFGNELKLTAEGREAAFSLGQGMAKIPIGEVHTSPVLRCVQTAEELLKGANQKVPLLKSNVLGDPGPFVADAEKAGPLFLETSIEDIAQSIVDGKEPPGMRSLEEGAYIFLKSISQIKHFPCLMITHDMVISLLSCFLFKSRNVRKHMPDFLDGIAIDFQKL